MTSPLSSTRSSNPDGIAPYCPSPCPSVGSFTHHMKWTPLFSNPRASSSI
uniref:Uncharacterized protein n=1 Tax=Rhizophora mucronata TaxID=61149 RepID=A0A2P2P582_RHIMU